MFAGAGVCRAIALIAAGILCVSSAPAQDEAARIVENFARDGQRAEARKAETAHRSAQVKKQDKQVSPKQSELRKDAAAQHAEAVARRKAAEHRAAEEAEMLERARQEAEELKATAEIRQLVEEAEAARRRVESMLPASSSTVVQAPVEAEKQPPDVAMQGKKQRDNAAEQRARALAAEAKAAEEARKATVRVAEHNQRVRSLTRAARLRADNATARQRRFEEQQAARQRDELQQLALEQQHARRVRTSFTRVAQLRRDRLQALARAAQERAQAARHAVVQTAPDIQQTAQAPRLEMPERQFSEREVTAVESKALSPGEVQEALPRPTWRPAGQPQLAAGEPYGRSTEPQTEWTGQVTVLVVMAPGTYGIRRGARTADPILCAAEGCYVSAGPERGSIFLRGRKALGFGNTFGRRAGACRQRLGCVFRGVSFDYPGVLQPVDLHILKHDRRRPQQIVADSHCRIAGGHLVCHRPIHGDDYIMWVVPERLADRAGPELLERALRTGLSPVRSAETRADH